MKIALLGYGKMGHMIEQIAVSRGHEIVLRLDNGTHDEEVTAQLRQADVAIEFSMPAVAVDNYLWCVDNGIPVV